MTRDANVVPLSGPIDSIASKLLSAANFWRRSGNAYYRKHFRLTITEVRILTFLEARAPTSLNAMADHCGVDKTQMSRAVTGLVRRKLVSRRRSVDNPGEIELRLDGKGVDLCRRVHHGTRERLARLVESLSAGDVKQLDRILDTLLENTRSSLEGQTDGPQRAAERTTG